MVCYNETKVRNRLEECKENMMIKIYDVQYDEVIKSFYLTAGIDYDYALKNLVPLINKLEFQRIPLGLLFTKDWKKISNLAALCQISQLPSRLLI